jgi:hypothetical protein
MVLLVDIGSLFQLLFLLMLFLSVLPLALCRYAKYFPLENGWP